MGLNGSGCHEFESGGDRERLASCVVRTYVLLLLLHYILSPPLVTYATTATNSQAEYWYPVNVIASY
jgi:hypothetical protein